MPIQTFVRVNNRIRVPQVRCVGADGSQIGILPTHEALAKANEAGLDLVEIAPTAQPPVCRIMDYGKFKYDLEKKEKAARKHHTATRVKEVQLHPNVAEHDYQTKLRHIQMFLEEGHRVKVGLFFRGRENAHHEIGFEVMNRVLRDTQALSVPEQAPRLLGRSLHMLLTPRPGARPKPKSSGPAAPPADPAVAAP